MFTLLVRGAGTSRSEFHGILLATFALTLFVCSLVRRKTGVTLKDTGIRDEYGMQPIDDIFSSPEKGGNDSDDGEADMDLTTGKNNHMRATKKSTR